MPRSRRIFRVTQFGTTRCAGMMRLVLAAAASMLVLAGARPAAAQSSGRAAGGTASSDSAIYSAFFETVNRQPRDTVFADERSIVFQGISPHYDSVAPGLAATLVKVSAPPRTTASLHLPPPIVVISASTPQALRERAINGPPGERPGAAQGVRGVWRVSPIAYSADSKDAMFYYRVVCGLRCGEEAIVWARKDAKGRWDIRHTAILAVM